MPTIWVPPNGQSSPAPAPAAQAAVALGGECLPSAAGEGAPPQLAAASALQSDDDSGPVQWQEKCLSEKEKPVAVDPVVEEERELRRRIKYSLATQHTLRTEVEEENKAEQHSRSVCNFHDGMMAGMSAMQQQMLMSQMGMAMGYGGMGGMGMPQAPQEQYHNGMMNGMTMQQQMLQMVLQSKLQQERSEQALMQLHMQWQQRELELQMQLLNQQLSCYGGAMAKAATTEGKRKRKRTDAERGAEVEAKRQPPKQTPEYVTPNDSDFVLSLADDREGMYRDLMFKSFRRFENEKHLGVSAIEFGRNLFKEMKNGLLGQGGRYLKCTNARVELRSENAAYRKFIVVSAEVAEEKVRKDFYRRNESPHLWNNTSAGAAPVGKKKEHLLEEEQQRNNDERDPLQLQQELRAAKDSGPREPASKAELLALVDSLFEAVTDKDTMTVKGINRSVAEHYGWAADEFKRKSRKPMKNAIKARLTELNTMEQRRAKMKRAKRNAMEHKLRVKLRKEDGIYGVGATLDRIPGDVLMDEIVPHLEVQDLLYLAMTCTHFAPVATRRVVVPKEIFDPTDILKRALFRKPGHINAYHVTPLSLKDFLRFDLSLMTNGSAKAQNWYNGLSDQEQNRLRELDEQARRLREEEDKHQICLMPEWMVKEHGGEVARNSGKKSETECFVSTDGNVALRHCLVKKARVAQIKSGLNMLVFDKAEVDASFAHQVSMHKDGPGAKVQQWSQSFGATAIPIPVKEAYLVLGTGGPEPQFICYFRDGKFLDVDVPGLEGGDLV